MYIMNPICGCILSQHALEDCTIKFESNSFRILVSAGYNSFQVFDAGSKKDWIKEKKRKFTLFSDHNGSLLRREPGAQTGSTKM